MFFVLFFMIKKGEYIKLKNLLLNILLYTFLSCWKRKICKMKNEKKLGKRERGRLKMMDNVLL